MTGGERRLEAVLIAHAVVLLGRHLFLLEIIFIREVRVDRARIELPGLVHLLRIFDYHRRISLARLCIYDGGQTPAVR